MEVMVVMEDMVVVVSKGKMVSMAWMVQRVLKARKEKQGQVLSKKI